MQFSIKSIVLSAAVLTTVVGSTLAASTAEAITIKPGSRFQFGSLQNINISSTAIDFGDNGIGADGSIALTGVLLADGVTKDTDFSPIPAGGTVKDIVFGAATLPNFITIPLVGDTLIFDLLSPAIASLGNLPGPDNTYRTVLNGQFRLASSGATLANGLLTAQVPDTFVLGTSTAISSFSISATAVPTPALLPGLIGMGVAAIRKRKDESKITEAVETNA